MCWAAATASAQTAAISTGPITLEQALTLAEARSEAVAIARVGVERAHGEQVRARSGRLPQLSASASYDRALASEFEGIFDVGATPACARLRRTRARRWPIVCRKSSGRSTAGRSATPSPAAVATTASEACRSAAGNMARELRVGPDGRPKSIPLGHVARISRRSDPRASIISTASASSPSRPIRAPPAGRAP